MSRNYIHSPPRSFSSVVRHPYSQHPTRPMAYKRTFRRRLKYLYLRLVRLRGSPKGIARGLACGVFAGLFPLFGFQIMMGVLLAVLLRGNKFLAVAGTWISNPFTYVPIYAFNFHVGQLLLNQEDLTDISLNSWQSVKELGAEIIFTLLVGCFAVGSVCAVSSYFLGLWLIRRSRRS